MATNYKELRVWQNAMDWATKIFDWSKAFPPEERYSLTDQIRRSSRSVATNIAEAWRKHRYVASFVAKLSDSESEAAETQTSTEIARRCRYWSDEIAAEIDQKYEEILAQLSNMIRDADRWCLPPGTR